MSKRETDEQVERVARALYRADPVGCEIAMAQGSDLRVMARAAIAAVREAEGWRTHISALMLLTREDLGAPCADFDPDCWCCQAWNALGELQGVLADAGILPPEPARDATSSLPLDDALVERVARLMADTAFEHPGIWDEQLSDAARDAWREKARAAIAAVPDDAVIEGAPVREDRAEALAAALREVERTYYTEGKSDAWIAAHMRDAAERGLAALSASESRDE